jgi:UDP-N-acetyl-D-mannosaminuronic acid transferase (WecB/TagA/CpsF family)
MKVLIVTQYFWPEYFRVNDLALDLSKKGYKVEVLTTYPNYPYGKVFDEFLKNRKNFENFNGIKVFRVPSVPRKEGTKINLVINYLSFLFSGIFIGFFKLRKRKYDLIITFATSPIIVALISIFFSKIKKTLHFIWVLDLWPHVLNDLKIVKKSSFVYKFFLLLVKFIYTESDKILCQSLAFKKKIEEINKEFKKKLIFFPSWPEGINENVLLEKSQKFFFEKDYLNILFTGNIGDSQNFELVIDLIEKTKNKKIAWHIAGEGRKYNWLKKEKKKRNLDNLHLHGFINFHNLQQYLNYTDVVLLSLKPGETFDSTIPGKFQTYLQYKKFFLGLIGGEVNAIIKKYKIGLATDSQNLNILSAILDDLLSLKKSNFFDTYNNRYYEILLKIFSRKRIINKIFYLYSKELDKLYLITETKQIPFYSNFILSGLNLAFLGSYANNEMPISKNILLWPDGFFRKKYFTKNVRKIPGSELISNLYIEKSLVNRIVVLGNLENISKTYLQKTYGLTVLNYKLPYGSIEDIKKFVPILEKKDLCLITLPTPKQEQLAHYICNTQKHYKIICIGGGLNIVSGVESRLPNFLNDIFFAEALWRLRYEFRRRFSRLVKTFYYYFLGEVRNSFKKLKIKEYEKF